MNDLQKGFWGGALRIGSALGRAYGAGADRAARLGGDMAARRSWTLSERAGYRPEVAFDSGDRAARWGHRTGRRAFHGAAAAGAAGATFAGGRAAMGGREYPSRTDQEFRGERRSGWSAWRAKRGERAEKAAAAAGLTKGWMRATQDDYRRTSRRDAMIDAGFAAAPMAALGGVAGAAAFGRSRIGRVAGGIAGAVAAGAPTALFRYGAARTMDRAVMEPAIRATGGFDAPGEKKESGWAAWRAKGGDGGGGSAATAPRAAEPPPAARRAGVLPDYDGNEVHLRDRKNGGYIVLRGENAHYLTDDEFGAYSRELRRSAPVTDLAKSIAALPLAKRAALADAVESGDVRALSAAFG